jgi:hypothetical protein
MSADVPAYPISRPATIGSTDSRLTVGLALNVAAVQARHGYPPRSTGSDLLRLQQALFTLIHQEHR